MKCKYYLKFSSKNEHRQWHEYKQEIFLFVNLIIKFTCELNLKITNMYLTDTDYTFVFNDVLKHFRPSFKEKPLVFRVFP